MGVGNKVVRWEEIKVQAYALGRSSTHQSEKHTHHCDLGNRSPNLTSPE